MNTTAHQVHISHDGQLDIDDEAQVVPDGVDPAHVAVQTLHIEAAAGGTPVLVHVHDDRSNSLFDMMVMPDGTTRAPHAEPTTLPPPAAHDDLAHRLATAQAAGRAHDFATAVPAADDILQQLTTELGDTAEDTLQVAQFRADLAVLSGDYAFATASWTWIALAWLDRLGPGKRRTQVAAQNATWAWTRLSPQEAMSSAPELLDMLLEIAAPEQTQTMRSHIETRLREIPK